MGSSYNSAYTLAMVYKLGVLVEYDINALSMDRYTI